MDAYTIYCLIIIVIGLIFLIFSSEDHITLKLSSAVIIIISAIAIPNHWIHKDIREIKDHLGIVEQQE